MYCSDEDNRSDPETQRPYLDDQELDGDDGQLLYMDDADDSGVKMKPPPEPETAGSGPFTDPFHPPVNYPTLAISQNHVYSFAQKWIDSIKCHTQKLAETGPLPNSKKPLHTGLLEYFSRDFRFKPKDEWNIPPQPSERDWGGGSFSGDGASGDWT